MLQALRDFALSDAFMPHGMCLLWRPELLALHAVSDFLIAAAYFTIPLVILKVARRRPDLVDASIARLFAAFITACALSHLAAILTIWVPAYGIQGMIKAATAVVSVYTAVELARLMPGLLTMPSREDLAEKEAALLMHRHENARVQEANDKLNEFAYVASHDLRAPMRGIANHARFLDEDHGPDLCPDAQQRIARIQELCRHAEHLIVTLLQYSRISRAEAQEDVALSEIVEQIRDQLAETLAERNGRVVVETPLPVVKGNPADVMTALNNLVLNGLTYNDSDKPEVRIGYLDQANVDGATLHKAVYVTDNGIGVAPEDQATIFRMFKRLHGPDVYGAGTGAGLAFVRRVIQAQGGTVRLRSVVGEGSTFFVTFEGEADAIQVSAGPAIRVA